MSYRLAASLARLRDEGNRRWPGRDKASDGWIGDPDHASRSSDHNPWVRDSRGVGVVRAFDFDAGPGGNRDVGLWVAEHVRSLGRDGHPALRGAGYVISARRIASPRQSWAWRRYVGPNPHTSHTHVSVSTVQREYDSTQPWGIGGDRLLQLEDPMLRGDDVAELQAVLDAWYPFLDLDVDGWFGDDTDAAVRELQRRAGLVVDGIVGPATRGVLNL